MPSEPFEHPIVEIGKPLEAKGQLSRGADGLRHLTRSAPVEQLLVLSHQCFGQFFHAPALKIDGTLLQEMGTWAC